MSVGQSLVSVLEEARTMLARRENDFVYSSWDGAEQAMSEIDDHIAALKSAV